MHDLTTIVKLRRSAQVFAHFITAFTGGCEGEERWKPCRHPAGLVPEPVGLDSAIQCAYSDGAVLTGPPED